MKGQRSLALQSGALLPKSPSLLIMEARKTSRWLTVAFRRWSKRNTAWGWRYRSLIPLCLLSNRDCASTDFYRDEGESGALEDPRTQTALRECRLHRVTTVIIPTLDRHHAMCASPKTCLAIPTLRRSSPYCGHAYIQWQRSTGCSLAANP